MMTTLYLLLLILQVFSCMNVEQVSALIPGKCYFLLVFNGMDRFLYNWIFFTWVGGGDEKLLSIFNACLLYS